MLESLCEPGAHALMLYPTKALALDQREQLTRLTSAMAGPEIESWWYDGDTDREHRTVLRKTPPPILITNPDMLHLRTVMAGLACVAEGKSVLAFCPTRKFAEACYPIAMRELERREEAGEPLIDPSAVRVFRSDLAVEERHAVQEGLKSG